MSLTLGDVLTSLAYRLREDSSPTSASEKARRTSAINEGYRNVIRDYPYWFTETSTTLNSVADQETYTTSDGFPSDYRDAIELRVDDILYTYIQNTEVLGVYDEDYQDSLGNHFFIYNNTLHILPAPTSDGTGNITLKYYKFPDKVSNDSDTFVIPDTYLDALVAFAYGRISQQNGFRGDASDGFNEFKEILGDITMENNRRIFYNKTAGSPSSVVE